MKNFKKIFATILMVCMMFSICACGNGNTENTGSENNKPGTEADTTVDTGKESEDDGKIVYKVKLVDESNNPIAGTYVQLCDDKSCYLPVMTDANGIAEFEMAEGEYKAAISVMPEGYVDVTGEYFYFEGDATEVVVTLQKAA